MLIAIVLGLIAGAIVYVAGCLVQGMDPFGDVLFDDQDDWDEYNEEGELYW